MASIPKNYGFSNLGQIHIIMIMAIISLTSGLVGSTLASVFYQVSNKLLNIKDITILKIFWEEVIINIVIFALITYSMIFLISPWIYPLISASTWEFAGSTAETIITTVFFCLLARSIHRIKIALEIESYLPVQHSLKLLILSLSIIISLYFGLNYIEFIKFLSISLFLIHTLEPFLGRFYLIVRYSKYE